MQLSRNGCNKGSSGSCTLDNRFDSASTTTGGEVLTSHWGHDLSFPELGLCPNLTQIFGNLGGSLADESVILDHASMLGCRKANGSNPSISLARQHLNGLSSEHTSTASDLLRGPFTAPQTVPPHRLENTPPLTICLLLKRTFLLILHTRWHITSLGRIDALKTAFLSQLMVGLQCFTHLTP